MPHPARLSRPKGYLGVAGNLLPGWTIALLALSLLVPVRPGPPGCLLGPPSGPGRRRSPALPWGPGGVSCSRTALVPTAEPGLPHIRSTACRCSCCGDCGLSVLTCFLPAPTPPAPPPAAGSGAAPPSNTPHLRSACPSGRSIPLWPRCSSDCRPGSGRRRSRRPAGWAPPGWFCLGLLPLVRPLAANLAAGRLDADRRLARPGPDARRRADRREPGAAGLSDGGRRGRDRGRRRAGGRPGGRSARRCRSRARGDLGPQADCEGEPEPPAEPRSDEDAASPRPPSPLSPSRRGTRASGRSRAADHRRPAAAGPRPGPR